jgi:hypothetical protein
MPSRNEHAYLEQCRLPKAQAVAPAGACRTSAACP